MRLFETGTDDVAIDWYSLLQPTPATTKPDAIV
jgi:hypothetical protein